MARIRTIKPEFWQDEKLGPLAPIDRLVFLGLISQADDAGRLVDCPRMLNGLLFPYSEDDCSGSLETLARLGRVCRYTSASGQKLLQIVNWTMHQRVDKPSSYVLPAPTAEIQEPETVTKPSGDSPDTPATHSGDTRAPILDLGPTTNDLHTTTKPKDVCAFEGDFLTFWERYPLKVGKKAALKAYQARRRAGVTAEQITEGLTRYLAYKAATHERHHNPATFLGPSEYYAEPWTIPEAKAAPERKGNGPGEVALDPKFKRVWKPAITERRVAASPDKPAGNLKIELPGRGPT
jgi:hypothetical protein